MAAKRMQKYEMMMVLKPLLPDDVRKAIHKSIISLIEEQGGSVADTDVWGKRYLAYEIKKHNEGYYIVYTLELPTSALAEVKRLLDLKQEILRYMIVKLDKYSIVTNTLKKKEIEV